MTRRHLIAVLGGTPVEFDSGPEDHCASCGASTNDQGDVVHDAECAAAKALLSQDSLAHGDLGVAFVDAERRSLSAQYVEALLEQRQDDRALEALDDARRGEIVDAYLAGFQRAEARLLALVGPRLSRLREDLDQLASEIAALTGSEPTR